MNAEHPQALRDPLLELQTFRRRALLAGLLVLAVLSLLLARFAWLQLVEHEQYRTRSEANRVRLVPLAPSRGLIVDRNGEVLADNRPAFRLELIPEQVEGLERTLAELAELLELEQEDIDRFHELRRLRRSFHSIPLRYRMSELDQARFALNRHRFPGVDVVPYLTRHYPHGELFAHVVGYVGRMDASDRARLDLGRYAATSHVGKTGIERHYEDLLHGEVGLDRVETNAQGRVIRLLERTPPVPGRHLRLSLDARLQRAAVAAFEGQSGAAVAIDPRNGEVLAMVSLPSFDANLFVNGISRADFQALLNAPRRPLFNRVLQGTYEPGSTIKPFLALAGLELGLRSREYTIFSTGRFQLPGHEQVFRDWRRGGHGRVDLVQSLAQSVNVYYYQLALDLGIDRMHAFLAEFGFGAATGIDIGGESRAILPSREWKRATRNQPWFPGETVITGIGQGFFTATPLQLAHATAILAADGQRYVPHLLQATSSEGVDQWMAHEPPAPLPALALRPENLALVQRGMEAAVHGPTGTARLIGETAAFRIGGKTGTAQRFGLDRERDYDTAAVPEHLRHQALFIAYAPLDAPRIAVAVVAEHGGSGARAAAPIARRILDAWLLDGRD